MAIENEASKPVGGGQASGGDRPPSSCTDGRQGPAQKPFAGHGVRQAAIEDTVGFFFSTEIRPQLTEPEVALWRSQQGPLASVPFVAFPTNRAT